MPWPNPAFPPFAPPGQQPPRRRRQGLAGWILTGVLGVAVFAAAGIVLWPGKENAREASGNSSTPPPGTTTTITSPPSGNVPPTQKKFWVDTFSAAEGYREPSTSGEPVGELRKGTHYVFCKRSGDRVERNGQFNRWWLLTNLDQVYGSGGPRAYVPALYLTHWGNNEAKDNDGTEIPTCPS